jgi:hypothetical protein
MSRHRNKTLDFSNPRKQKLALYVDFKSQCVAIVRLRTQATLFLSIRTLRAGVGSRWMGEVLHFHSRQQLTQPLVQLAPWELFHSVKSAAA